jgi:hypothetical protein
MNSVIAGSLSGFDSSQLSPPLDEMGKVMADCAKRLAEVVDTEDEEVVKKISLAFAKLEEARQLFIDAATDKHGLQRRGEIRATQERAIGGAVSKEPIPPTPHAGPVQVAAAQAKRASTQTSRTTPSDKD